MSQSINTISSGSKKQYSPSDIFGCLECPRESGRCGEMCDLEEKKWRRRQQQAYVPRETVVHSRTNAEVGYLGTTKNLRSE